jgi:hypothetical protein
MSSVRDLDPIVAAQLIANGGWPAFLLDIFLDEQTVRIGAGFIGQVLDTSEPGGHLYNGLGELGSFTIGAEKIGGLASGASYSVSGIDPSTNTEIAGFRNALGEDLQTRIQGRRVRLRLAALNGASQLIGTPYLVRDDIGDSLVLNDSGAQLELVMTAESPSVDFKRLRRNTNSAVDHKRLHPALPPDTFYDDDRWRRTDIRWGQKKSAGDPSA